jgi:hypothetical protein
MEPLGINVGLLLIQIVIALLVLGLPVISLIALAKKQLTGIPLALWVLIICVVPLLGSLAYWIIRPIPESKN